MQKGITGEVKQVTTKTPANLLTESLTAKLRLSKTEQEAIQAIADADERTPEQVVNTMIHRTMQAEVEDALGKTTKGERLFKQLIKEQDTIFAEDELVPEVKDDGKTEITITVRIQRKQLADFQKMFNERTQQEYFNDILDDHMGHLMYKNPELLDYYRQWQREDQCEEKED
jgi:hypothetical protein